MTVPVSPIRRSTREPIRPARRDALDDTDLILCISSITTRSGSKSVTALSTTSAMVLDPT